MLHVDSTQTVPRTLPRIAETEYRERVAGLQRAMDIERLDALVLTSEDHFQYFTGFHSPTWLNLTRPRFCIIPCKSDPIIIIPSNNAFIARQTSWISDVRTWVSPCPSDEGVTLVADAIRAAATTFRRVGAELGPESRLTMPVADFLRLGTSIAPVSIVDGFSTLIAPRMVKSEAEVKRMRTIAEIASLAFERLGANMRTGETEAQIAQRLRVDILRHGAQDVPYMTGSSARGGYPSVNSGLSERVVRPGDMLTLATGSVYDGYFCCFNRNYYFGRPPDALRRRHELLWDATEDALDFAGPGIRASEVWRTLRARLQSERAGGHLRQGRSGHGVGLRLCEPPSISASDDTVLMPGMVITLEPSIAFEGSGSESFLLHEEDVLITDRGCETLTRRASRELTLID
jgi:Xaa-Pro dipeptidase